MPRRSSSRMRTRVYIPVVCHTVEAWKEEAREVRSVRDRTEARGLPHSMTMCTPPIEVRQRLNWPAPSFKHCNSLLFNNYLSWKFRDSKSTTA